VASEGSETSNDPRTEPPRGRALPRLELDPNKPSDQAPWSYTGRSERGRARHFTGHVTSLGGAAGERLQGELAVVIRDLLRWAAQARNAAGESSEKHEDTAV
jgi:hypothetical protein